MQQQKYTCQSDFAKKYVAEGLEQGREQGLEQGHRTLLRDLLQQRFGELPADASARLDEADVDTLTLWARRVLTAGNLAEVFAPESR